MKMNESTSRRNFIRQAAMIGGAIAAPDVAESAVAQSATPAGSPNVLMYCSDQFRADFLGINGKNPSVITPNLDALARRGTNFQTAICNQPLCSPSRASFLTSRYATETDVWKLDLELNHSLPTIATEFRKAGYSANFMGKWHVSGPDAQGKQRRGWIPPGPSRGGFDDLWEGANSLETVSHPYEGNYYADNGDDIGYKNEYRVDFITDRAVNFIQGKHDKPWFLYVSQLEPHQQNDMDAMVPPERYAKDYGNSFVPQDLPNLPGDWRTHLQGYYGCVQAIDDSIGRIVEALRKTGQLDNTIILFFSDHGCTFKTRLGEYKRSPHEAALRVPLLVAGPGFDRAQVVTELVSLLDLTPTLLQGAGVPVPASMKGRPLKPLAEDAAVRSAWRQEAYVQISSSICGRAIRTKDWTLCVYDPSIPMGDAPYSKQYTDFCLYQLGADPYQQVNLAGRPEYKAIGNTLRARLQEMIAEDAEPAATLTPAQFYV